MTAVRLYVSVREDKARDARQVALEVPLELPTVIANEALSETGWTAPALVNHVIRHALSIGASYTAKVEPITEPGPTLGQPGRPKQVKRGPGKVDLTADKPERGK
jgi:hypothetical protein